nr:ankycorbin-like [Lytechinus pictus]
MAKSCLGSQIFEIAEYGDSEKLLSLIQSHSQSEVHQALRWRRRWRVLARYRDPDGRNALSVAAANGHTEVIKALIKFNAIEIEKADFLASSEVGGSVVGSLFYAFKNEQYESAHALIAAGVDPSQDLLLHALVIWSSIQCRRIYPFMTLLEGKIDFDQKDEDGQTALMLACKQRNHTMVQALLKYGADPNVQDSNVSTSLQN